MKIMSINAGSSSLKFSLFDMDSSTCIASGYFERVTLPNSFYTIKYNGEMYLIRFIIFLYFNFSIILAINIIAKTINTISIRK